MEHALRNAMRANDLTPLCLKPGELDAYRHGTLQPQVTAHVVGCRECQSLLAALARLPAAPPPLDAGARPPEPWLHRVLGRAIPADRDPWTAE